MATRKRKSRPRAERARQTIDRLIRKQRPIIVAVFGCVLVLRLAPLVFPILARFTLEPILDGRGESFNGVTIGPQELLLLVFAAAGLVTVTRALANYLHVALSGRSGQRLVADMRVAMFKHVLRLPTAYAESRSTGKILLRFIGDSDALRSWISKRQPAVRADQTLLVIISLVMVLVNWRLALVTLAPLPVMWLAVTALSPRLQSLTRKSRALQATFTGHVQLRFGNIRQSKWFDAVPGFRKPIQRLASDIAEQNTARERWSALIDSVGEAAPFLLLAPLIWVGLGFVQDDSIGTGEFVALLWLAVHLGATVRRLCASVVIRQKAMVSLERIARLLERTAERGRSSKLKRLSMETPSIEFDEVLLQKTGSQSTPEPISFNLSGPGFKVPDGALRVGTLLETVLGFNRVKRGRILLGGQVLSETNISSVRAAIGWLPSAPAIFDASIEDNIKLASPGVDRAVLVSMIRDAELVSGDIHEWLTTAAEPNGVNLSAKDIAAVSVCRILIRKPSILFVEPQADAETARIVARSVLSLKEDALIVVDPSIVLFVEDELGDTAPDASTDALGDQRRDDSPRSNLRIL